MLSALPPVRRRLILGVIGLVVVAVLAAVVLVVVNRAGPSAASAEPVPQDRPGPVLLVPGYGGSTSALDTLAARLRTTGRDATVVRLPGDGTGELRDQATTLDRAVRAKLAGGAPSVDVVGYSAGGVVARLWVRSYGGGAVARRVVTLGSPHHGTKVAGLASVLAPDSCPVACRQLAPGSPLLDAVNAGDETPAGPRWVSLWTVDDETVTPPDSARLAGAVDIALQSVCAGVRISHGELPRSALVQGIVLAELAATPVVTPGAGDCARLS